MFTIFGSIRITVKDTRFDAFAFCMAKSEEAFSFFF